MDSPITPSAPPSLRAVALRYGVLAGLAGIVFSLITFLTNTDQTAVKWLGLVVSGVFIYLAHEQFKKLNGGFMEFGQGLGIGMLISLVSGLLGSVFFYFYVSFVDTGYVQKLMDITRTDMENRGQMDAAQIDDAMEMTATFMQPMVLFAFGLLLALFFGFLLSLVISLITKRSRPQFE